jgi:hypothetical protein
LLYEWRAKGFGALERQSRKDKGLCRALCPQAAEAIVKLRLQHPSLAISTLVRQLKESGVLQPALLGPPAFIDCWCAKDWIGLGS